MQQYREDEAEKGSVHEDDRPYLRPSYTPSPWFVVFGIVALVWLSALAYRYLLQEDVSPDVQIPPSAPTDLAGPPPASTSGEPAVSHPLQQPVERPDSLPTLENSDSMARRSLVGLVGNEAFLELVIPGQLVRRIVATVDNLPRPTAPTRVMPLNPVPGRFTTVGGEGETTIDGSNFERYLPYVRVLEMIDTPSLVSAYVRAYPLFQQAYEELGYSGKYFNDRLVEAVDDLLTAPDIDQPVKVMRTKVLYEFADPDLETCSAGQKIMIRIGSENEARVKAKLWEIRRALIAASKPRD